MAKQIETKLGTGKPVYTNIVKFMTDHKVPPSVGISLPRYVEIDGYRFGNIFVKFNQIASDEAPVDLGVIFAFDKDGTMSARRYVSVESNLGSQSTNFIEVSGSGSWNGSPYDTSSYLARVPVMGPYVNVSVYNRAPIERVVSVWGYFVS